MRNLWNDESGQTLAEYAILAGLVALVTIGAVKLMGTGMRATLQHIANELQKPL